MKIPKHINISGIEIDIAYKKMEGLAGTFMHGHGVIMINPEFPKDMQYSTFLHEVLEAVNKIYGIGLKHDQVCALEGALNGLGATVKESK